MAAWPLAPAAVLASFTRGSIVLFLAYLSAFFSHLQGQVADYLVLTVVNAPDVGTFTWKGLRHVGHSCN